MKKNVFAVCDLEVDYALNFMEYRSFAKRHLALMLKDFRKNDSEV